MPGTCLMVAFVLLQGVPEHCVFVHTHRPKPIFLWDIVLLIIRVDMEDWWLPNMLWWFLAELMQQAQHIISTWAVNTHTLTYRYTCV